LPAAPIQANSLALSEALLPSGIHLNEVMPKAGPGGYERIELYNPTIYNLYIPVTLRSSAGAVGAMGALSGLSSGATLNGGPLDISGWQLSD